MYVVHLSVVVPMLALEVPFGKWSHLAYRPLAMYFADVRAEALAQAGAGCRCRPKACGPREEVTAMEEPRIGVYVCNCGTNIAKVVDCDAVAEAAATLPGVVVARSYKYMCSNPGQEMIVQDIEEHALERVVVAACSPRMHEQTFRRALETAGLNPYLLEMANIREQCSWVHDDAALATEKAQALVHAAVQPGRSPRAAGADVGRHVLQHAGHRRRHRRHDGGARTGRRRQPRLPRREARIISAATSPASTSRRRTSTPRATY